ncbi:hypothetical protein FEDK69T_03710 [Flavobacterium enshiense DK69]|uniref:Secretion system C-terminal sorting domain-containing protein n=1 Tax=Flavobacterium enshiense DK69 TaxID=1107311 RepID=V6SDR3_9FLAO|nr:T9SS type A sorting domain-containing protein [Flavobacterium enshiense]ESU24818.1 hypothetical protein FEDK69T_03710 [Flavobacterium enshiense DK69]KGO96728.1 hypothetical protein Q767_03195 [Flavobacterium enshiense DK69]
MNRKLLLFSILLGLYIPAKAQVLQSDNFNSLTVGNIGADFTGATPGQGGWLTLASNGATPTTTTNAGNANFQIVAAGGTNANVFSLQGPNGDKGSRLMWKSGLAAAWGTRTAGNNIIEIEVDINPGTRGASLNDFGLSLFNSDRTKQLCGFRVDAASGELFLVAYSYPQGAPGPNNYIYPIDVDTPVLLPQNQYSRIGVSFNSVTGAVLIKGPGIGAAGIGIPGSAAGIVPNQTELLATAGASATPLNAASATMTFDNFLIKASATDTLLGTEAFTSVESSKLSVYPNPANNIVTISNAENLQINAVVITDVNGRTVKTLEFGGVAETQINVSDLNSGIYFMSIDTNEGTATKKIIKN